MWIQRLVDRLFARDAAPPAPIPPRPPDWNLTIADLFAEMEAGTRKSVGPPEADWAREYEHSLIPGDARFPRTGDVYAVREDRAVTYLTAWKAPYTLSGEGVLKAGDRIRVTGALEERPIGVYAEAVDYDELEARMVPETDRKASKYGGFYFHFSTLELIEHFELVEEGEAG